MSKIYEFLEECGAFYVLTLDGDYPAGRPFGAVMESEGDLYISTANNKAVYHQLIQNAKMQIIAMKPGTREWIRINGQAAECKKIEQKELMLKECPNLIKHYGSAYNEQFALFQIKVEAAALHTDLGEQKLI